MGETRLLDLPDPCKHFLTSLEGTNSFALPGAATGWPRANQWGSQVFGLGWVIEWVTDWRLTLSNWKCNRVGKRIRIGIGDRGAWTFRERQLVWVESHTRRQVQSMQGKKRYE
jgi:hypothetical protein